MDRQLTGKQPFSHASLVMCIQLSLFDLPGNGDAVSPVVSVAPSHREATAGHAVSATTAGCQELQPIRLYGEARREDSIQPMGDLARIVLARYEMMARRREEMMRRKAEQPRRSIRVLSPVSA
jgi:hypothetical protein